MGQLRDGIKAVAAAGTAVRLVAASTPAAWVKIQANEGNTADSMIVVGGTTVDATEATRRGIALPAATPVVAAGFGRGVLHIQGPIDLTDIWLDAETNADAVNFIYEEM